MAEVVRVVVDAMGGDYAPVEPVKAAVEAVKERDDIQVILTGVEDVVQAELKKYQDYPKDRIQVVNATEVIETAEPPVFAIRKKKDSSIVVGLKMIKEKKADAFVSSGSTGAVLVGGQVLVGRSKGVERPPLAPLIPTAKGVSLLIDCGANVDARPSHLVQFAKMGSIYMENVVGIKNPRVAIVNNGAEEEKGNALVKETFPLLKEIEGINFIGFHNYTGGGERYATYVEPMVRISYRGIVPQAMLDNSLSCRWGALPLRLKEFAFGSQRALDVPRGAEAFGSDCSLISKTPDEHYRNTQRLMRDVLRMAHDRDIEMAMGFEFGVVPPEYFSLYAAGSCFFWLGAGNMVPNPCHPTSVELHRAALDDLLENYPDIDYVWL